MTQVSSQLWQVVSWLQEPAHEPAYRTLRRMARRYTKPGWLVAATTAVLLAAVDWRLVVTSGLGGSVGLGLYLAYMGRWQAPASWRKLWYRANRPLLMAIAGGSVATVSSATAIALWNEAHNPALAGGLLLQGLMTVALVGMLMERSRPHAPARSMRPLLPPPSLDTIVAQLAHPNPLKRRIAIHQALEYALEVSVVDPMVLHYLCDCFHFVLDQETEPELRQALVAGLQQLRQDHQLTAGENPFVLPLGELWQPLPEAMSDRSGEWLEEPNLRATQLNVSTRAAFNP
ncbi:hypothetical protein ACQ4M4_20820 [Leptolyngbya sp. AN02str]|uniref:hypothetical protein n=1 Tax=Leptolyngbya sp. AN02str TaxID=3423363 RepID=UPI003D31BC7E